VSSNVSWQVPESSWIGADELEGPIRPSSCEVHDLLDAVTEPSEWASKESGGGSSGTVDRSMPFAITVVGS
jgi:hypothetical protein